MKIWTHRIAQNMNKNFEKFCPEYLGHNFSIFFVHILGNATTSYFRFEIYWPLVRPNEPDQPDLNIDHDDHPDPTQPDFGLSGSNKTHNRLGWVQIGFIKYIIGLNPYLNPSCGQPD
jgi:hypothetical protein